MMRIEAIRRAQRESYAMKAQRIIASHGAQGFACSAVAEVIFAVSFEPADGRAARDHLFMVNRAQPDTGAQRFTPPSCASRRSVTRRRREVRGGGHDYFAASEPFT